MELGRSPRARSATKCVSGGPGGEAPGKFLVFLDPDDYKTAKFIENDNLSRRIRRRSSETVPGVECSIKFQIGTF